MAPPMGIGIGISLPPRIGTPVAGGLTPLAFDEFNRSDSTGLGTADSGQSWSDTLNGWNVVSNQAKSRTTGTCISSVDIGVTDMRVDAAVVSVSNNCGVAARVTDASNYIRYMQTGSVLSIVQVLSGATTTLGSNFSHSPTPGDVLRLNVHGTSVTGYLNGVAVITGTTSLATGTRAGLYSGLALGILDSFKAYAT